MSWYRVHLETDGDTVLVTSPDFPEVTTFGVNVQDALSHGTDAIEEAIAARIADAWKSRLLRPARQAMVTTYS